MENNNTIEILVENGISLGDSISIPMLKTHGRFVEKEEIVEVALSFLEEDMKVLIVSREAWALWRLVVENAKKRGLNHFLVDALDIDETQLVHSSLEELLRARLIYFSKISPRIAVLEKKDLSSIKVDRRTVLARGVIGVTLEYKEKPIETDLCKFREFSRLCRECLTVHGGNVGVVSYSLCSLDVLSIPSYSREAFYSYLDVLNPRRGFVVFIPRNAMSEFLEKIRRPSIEDIGIVTVPIGCPYAIGIEELLYSLYRGLIPLVVDRLEEPLFHDSYCSKGRGIYIDTVVHDYEKLAGKPLLVRIDDVISIVKEGQEFETGAYSTSYKAGYKARRAAIEYLASRFKEGRKLSLETLFIGNVYVDLGRCTLCSACARECPTDALLFSARADREELVFRHERCIACYWCVEVCPHSAIRVVRELDTARINVEHVLASDEVVHCLNCGKSIGSKRLVLSVIEKLASRGINGDRIKVFYLCNECKVKYQLGLIDLNNVEMPSR